MTDPKQAPVTVRRFSCFEIEDGVYEHAEGRHVAYTDYAKVEAERDALAKDAQRWRFCVENGFPIRCRTILGTIRWECVKDDGNDYSTANDALDAALTLEQKNAD